VTGPTTVVDVGEGREAHMCLCLERRIVERLLEGTVAERHRGLGSLGDEHDPREQEQRPRPRLPGVS
jgi:hypothetical protein